MTSEQGETTAAGGADWRADAEIDITGERCPMTFVRTRIALDRLGPGARLLVRLRGEEPLRNVPRSAEALGHHILARRDEADGVTVLLLECGGG